MSPEGIDYYSSDFYKDTSGSRHGARTSDITIIIIIVRTAGIMVLGSLGIILIYY